MSEETKREQQLQSHRDELMRVVMKRYVDAPDGVYIIGQAMSYDPKELRNMCDMEFVEMEEDSGGYRWCIFKFTYENGDYVTGGYPFLSFCKHGPTCKNGVITDWKFGRKVEVE